MFKDLMKLVSVASNVFGVLSYKVKVVTSGVCGKELSYLN